MCVSMAITFFGVLVLNGTQKVLKKLSATYVKNIFFLLLLYYNYLFLDGAGKGLSSF